MMEAHHENWVTEEATLPPSERSFGLTIGTVGLFIAFWLAWQKQLFWPALAASIASATLFALAVLRPNALRRANLSWLKLGLFLHRIVNPVFMGTLLFLVFTPSGLLLRLLGKDFMRLHKRPNDGSYWIKRQGSVNSMRNQF